MRLRCDNKLHVLRTDPLYYLRTQMVARIMKKKILIRVQSSETLKSIQFIGVGKQV
jgi:hypothetical protein